MRPARISVVFLVCLVPLLAFAEEPMVGDRPDFTESAQTVSLGRLQLEAGATFSDFADDGEQIAFGEALLRFGLADSFELRAGLGSWIERDAGREDVNGFDNVFIGIKYAFGRVEALDANVAVLAGSTLPWGDRDISERAWQPDAALAAEWELAEGLGLGANLGWTYARSDGERFGQLRASASLAFALSPELGAFVEAYAFSEESPDGSVAPYVDSGVVYSLRDNLALDARIGAGLGSAETDFFVGIGVVSRF